MHRRTIVGGLLALAIAPAGQASAAETSRAKAVAVKTCAPVRDIFEDSRYEGDLYRIRAQGTPCRTARRVARKGTSKAVAAVPNSQGRVIVRYRRWKIVDDLTGDVDRFVAKAPGGKRVRWLFGDI